LMAPAAPDIGFVRQKSAPGATRHPPCNVVCRLGRRPAPLGRADWWPSTAAGAPG
jgi:hypothetical protein